MRQPHVIVSANEDGVHVDHGGLHGNSWPTRYCVHTLVVGLNRNSAPLDNCTLTFVGHNLSTIHREGATSLKINGELAGV